LLIVVQGISGDRLQNGIRTRERDAVALAVAAHGSGTEASSRMASVIEFVKIAEE